MSNADAITTIEDFRRAVADADIVTTCSLGRYAPAESHRVYHDDHDADRRRIVELRIVTSRLAYIETTWLGGYNGTGWKHETRRVQTRVDKFSRAELNRLKRLLDDQYQLNVDLPGARVMGGPADFNLYRPEMRQQRNQAAAAEPGKLF